MREVLFLSLKKEVEIGNFHIKIGVSPCRFPQIPLNLHAKIQKNIRKLLILEKKDVSLHLNNKIIGDIEYEKDEFCCCSALCVVGFG